MTSPKLPTAAEALSLAFEIVATPCSAAETSRAMALFEIGRELRVASDMREINARRAAADRLRTDLDISRSRDKLAAAGIPAQVFPQVPASALTESTQRMPITWAVGDKADCRHCHTPIVFSMRRMEDEGEAQAIWRHKYTEQVVCAVPATAADVEGSEPTHSFAEPAPRG